MQCGEAEILREDSCHWTAALPAAGMQAALDERAQMWHNSQLYVRLVPEAIAALREISTVISGWLETD